MLNLKSIYFYFLALKISSIKFLKKIYFTTNFYNKSLNSKVPDKIYFFPNPFLLSSLTSHKNFSFNVSKIDPQIFWETNMKIKDIKNINNFFWLNLIDRKNKSNVIQKIITVWIYKNNKYKKIIWDNSILSKRLISWILNSDIILDNADDYFKKEFFGSIIYQVNHLKKNVIFEDNYLKKIEILTAILLTGLIFKEYLDNFNLASRELKKLVRNIFDSEGFPLDKNSCSLIKLSKYLILIRECIKDSHQYIPDFLDEIINKNLTCINSVLTPLMSIPLFNGSIELNLEDYFKYLKSLNYDLKKQNKVSSSISILKYKKNTIFFEISAPPEKSFSSFYQSGPLSFEYYFDNNKIVTNCGFGSQISKKGELLSRLTSAQSTLCIEDTSVIEFERNKLINTAFGNSINGRFKIFEKNYNTSSSEILTTASHNAYLKRFGYIHNRTIKIDKSNNDVHGQDILLKKENALDSKFSIRFHLYPGISAVKTLGGDSILIQIKKNKSLIFNSSGSIMNIEKSIFLGKNQIKNNLCIVISGNTNGENKSIDWFFKKSN